MSLPCVTEKLDQRIRLSAVERHRDDAFARRCTGRARRSAQVEGEERVELARLLAV